jgi:hypothetical protein
MFRYAYLWIAISNPLSKVRRADGAANLEDMTQCGQIGWYGTSALDKPRESGTGNMAPEAFLPVSLTACLFQTGSAVLHELAL